MVIKQSHVMYVLTCGHVVLSAPSLIGAKMSVWCPVDGKELRIQGIHKYEWRFRCGRCTYARWCGVSETLANQIANEHGHATGHFGKAEYVVNPSALDELTRLTRLKAILWTHGETRQPTHHADRRAHAAARNSTCLFSSRPLNYSYGGSDMAYDYDFLTIVPGMSNGYGRQYTGTCTSCHRRWSISSGDDTNATERLRKMYRRHHTPDNQPCPAGKAALSSDYVRYKLHIKNPQNEPAGKYIR
jgi:hypothetical protein